MKLKMRMEQIAEMRQNKMPTIPVTMEVEVATNPFLRCKSPEIRFHMGLESATDLEVFTKLRELRDNF